ncbi:helix-turn-helix domain-containing protein [Streptomyces sp. NPDC060194]|uniref:helix-turn-helix domain-containing protein n=1 Tax=Streptomyces sp. NPDC060194 TaxID=3347069 RepID=UPI003646EF34
MESEVAGHLPPRLTGHGFRRPGDVVAVRQTLTRPYRPHWHDFHEMVLVTGGSGVHRVDGVAYAVGTGDVLVVPPSSLHAVAPGPGGRLELVDVTLDVHGLPPEVPSLLAGLSTDTGPLRTGADDPVRRLFDELAGESESGRAHRRLVCDALVTQLIASLARDHRARPAADRGPVPAWLPRLLDHMERHYARPLGTDDLAAVAHLSAAHLRERFRQETGETLSGHLQQVRLRAAKALLATTDLPVAEVRRASGFGDASHFARAFRAAVGCSPTAYRSATR